MGLPYTSKFIADELQFCRMFHDHCDELNELRHAYMPDSSTIKLAIWIVNRAIEDHEDYTYTMEVKR